MLYEKKILFIALIIHVKKFVKDFRKKKPISLILFFSKQCSIMAQSKAVTPEVGGRKPRPLKSNPRKPRPPMEPQPHRPPKSKLTKQN